jgi:transcriptional regulator with XRE-family HTH domain
MRTKPGGIHYARVMGDAETGTSFADLIRTARESRGWTQDDLERATAAIGEHVSRSTISRWERGQADRPEPAHVRSVCKVLGIDPRRAAVSLGYLTQEEISSTYSPLGQELEEVLSALQDPRLPAEDRAAWINYLRYLQDRSRRQAG